LKKLNEEILFILKEEDILKKYILIIDYICNYLDKKINIHCDFQDGKCIANRINKSVHKENGCCYHNGSLCKYLGNHGCTTKAISCKFFICNYLEKTIKKININNIFPVKLVFNRKQINIIKRSYFKDRSEVIKLLLKYKKN